MSVTPSPGAITTRRTSPGGVVLLVIGVVLVLLGSAVLAAAAAGAVAARQRDGWFESPTTLFATDASALTTPGSADLTGGTIPQLPFDLGRIRIRVEGDRPVFVGIGPRADVERYLAGVHRSEVTGVRYRPFSVQYRDVAGTATPTPPTQQSFWVASASGSGAQQVEWSLRPGDWSIVVMNQDGGPGVSARIRAGFRSDLLGAVAAGVLAAAGGALLLGIPLLLIGTALIGRTLPDDVAADAEPVRLTGRAGEPLSRWLWLVKWLLAVPHYVVLAGLWVALVVTTIAAGVVVLFTGRYPPAWFAFVVGVLRWNWRVGFYASATLGTDRYPPFTLAAADYPAELRIRRPEHLANGLVLVKSWLLALPHYAVLAALAGGAVSLPVLGPWAASGGTTAGATAGLSVLGVLVLVGAVVLLFTGRYPRGVFDLAVGINRWAYRVMAYAALLRDEYPPFRLDQGPDEPSGAAPPMPGAPVQAEAEAR